MVLTSNNSSQPFYDLLQQRTLGAIVVGISTWYVEGAGAPPLQAVYTTASRNGVNRVN